MSSKQQDQRRGVVLRALDKFVVLTDRCLITDGDFVRIACLSALIGCGHQVDAETMARDGGPITKADALAAMGLLLARNLSKIGNGVKHEIARIGGTL